MWKARWVTTSWMVQAGHRDGAVLCSGVASWRTLAYAACSEVSASATVVGTCCSAPMATLPVLVHRTIRLAADRVARLAQNWAAKPFTHVATANSKASSRGFSIPVRHRNVNA